MMFPRLSVKSLLRMLPAKQVDKHHERGSFSDPTGRAAVAV
jgi:hypothetical protein